MNTFIRKNPVAKSYYKDKRYELSWSDNKIIAFYYNVIICIFLIIYLFTILLKYNKYRRFG